jgi:hypothetical protein
MGWLPSLKAGVNERQFVDDAVALVSRRFGHYPAFRPGKSVRSVFCVFSVFRGFNGFLKTGFHTLQPFSPRREYLS